MLLLLQPVPDRRKSSGLRALAMALRGSTQPPCRSSNYGIISTLELPALSNTG